MENVHIFKAEHSSRREGCRSRTLQLIIFFSLVNISSFCAQFKENDLGFLLLKDGNNLAILFHSLISVPVQFCLREKTANLDR